MRAPVDDDDLVIWRSLDWQPPAHPLPLYANEHEAMLVQCRDALQRRRDAYPALIARGMIEQGLADRDLAAWELLLAEWTWVVSGQGTPPSPGTHPQRLAALALAMERVEAELARGNRGFDIQRQFHLIDAMGWHLAGLNEAGEPDMHRCARANHRWRAVEGRQWCGTCERWCQDPEARVCTSADCGFPERRAA